MVSGAQDVEEVEAMEAKEIPIDPHKSSLTSVADIEGKTRV